MGMDYDSFSLKGGSKYFNEAQQIVLLAQSSNAPGWKSKESGKEIDFGWLIIFYISYLNHLENVFISIIEMVLICCSK